MFESVVAPYQKALDESGYNHKLEFIDVSSSLHQLLLEARIDLEEYHISIHHFPLMFNLM